VSFGTGVLALLLLLVVVVRQQGLLALQEVHLLLTLLVLTLLLPGMGLAQQQVATEVAGSLLAGVGIGTRCVVCYKLLQTA
jgi:hypothetical protein